MHVILIICSAVLGLLVFGLGFNVSMTRARTKDVHSAGSDPAGAMMKSVRAHANATEYAARDARHAPGRTPGQASDADGWSATAWHGAPWTTAERSSAVWTGP